MKLILLNFLLYSLWDSVKRDLDICKSWVLTYTLSFKSSNNFIEKSLNWRESEQNEKKMKKKKQVPWIFKTFDWNAKKRIKKQNTK